jgi:hypothetical protein
MGLWDDFLKIVDNNFKYLETEFGFRKVSTQVPFVTYESMVLRISIYYDIDGRKELDVGIEPLQEISSPQKSVHIGTLVWLHDPERHESYGSPFPCSKEELETEIQKYVALLQKYGADVLRGDLRDLVLLGKIEKEVGRLVGPPNPWKPYMQIVGEIMEKYSKAHLKEHAKEHQHKDEGK